MNDSIWTIFFSLCVSILFYWATTLKDQRLPSFHYDKQLLQKMVRLEIETEQTKPRMEQIKKETEQLKKEREQTKKETEQLKTEMEQLKKETEQTKKETKQLKNEMEQTEIEMEQMKTEMEQKILPSLDDLQKSTVAFSAYDPSNTSPPIDEVFVFRNVQLNEGSAYDRDTGVFTAPFSGIYHFTVHICNAHKHTAVVAIVHNGNVHALSTQYENTGSGCGSVSDLIRIYQGDTVNVVSTYEITKMFKNEHRRVSFIGFRLY